MNYFPLSISGITYFHDFLGSDASNDGLHGTDVARGLICKLPQEVGVEFSGFHVRRPRGVDLLCNLNKCITVALPTDTHTRTYYSYYAFSALMLLVGRQEGHPACKTTEWWGAEVVICLERGADLCEAQLMPLPLTVSCFSKIQITFTFLALAHPGSMEKG